MCDLCGERATEWGESRGDALFNLRSIAWIIGKKNTFCPVHNPKLPFRDYEEEYEEAEEI